MLFDHSVFAFTTDEGILRSMMQQRTLSFHFLKSRTHGTLSLHSVLATAPWKACASEYPLLFPVHSLYGRAGLLPQVRIKHGVFLNDTLNVEEEMNEYEDREDVGVYDASENGAYSYSNAKGPSSSASLLVCDLSLIISYYFRLHSKRMWPVAFNAPPTPTQLSMEFPIAEYVADEMAASALPTSAGRWHSFTDSNGNTRARLLLGRFVAHYANTRPLKTGFFLRNDFAHRRMLEADIRPLLVRLPLASFAKLDRRWWEPGYVLSRGDG